MHEGQPASLRTETRANWLCTTASLFLHCGAVSCSTTSLAHACHASGKCAQSRDESSGLGVLPGSDTSWIIVRADSDLTVGTSRSHGRGRDAATGPIRRRALPPPPPPPPPLPTPPVPSLAHRLSLPFPWSLNSPPPRLAASARTVCARTQGMSIYQTTDAVRTRPPPPPPPPAPPPYHYDAVPIARRQMQC
jgi:hypothetical protein